MGEILHIIDEAGEFSRFEIVIRGVGEKYPITMVITENEARYLTPVPMKDRVRELLAWRKSIEEVT